MGKLPSCSGTGGTGLSVPSPRYRATAVSYWGHVAEGLVSEAAALLQAGPSVRNSLGYPTVIRWVHHHGDEREVLGAGPQEGGTSNVDVFKGVLQRHAGLADGVHERIEVHYHQVDDLDVLSGQLFQVLRDVLPCQKASVDTRMEGLYPAVQDFRKPRQLRHLLDGKAPLLGEGAVGAAGAYQLHPCPM